VGFPFTLTNLKKDINFTPDNTYSLITHTGNLVGFGQIIEKEKFLHLARIIIDPAHRGKGYGKILCHQLIKTGRQKHGQKPFSLNVYARNENALALYLDLGFTPVNKPASLTATTDSVYMTLD
jgi:ribosomal protein S18 acetylase RimI-like enzyme